MTWAYRIFNMNCLDNYSLNHVMVFIIFRKEQPWQYTNLCACRYTKAFQLDVMSTENTIIFSFLASFWFDCPGRLLHDKNVA